MIDLDRRREESCRLAVPGTGHEHHRWIPGIEISANFLADRTDATFVEQREAGQRRPVRLWRGEPVGKQADRPLRRVPPSAGDLTHAGKTEFAA